MARTKARKARPAARARRKATARAATTKRPAKRPNARGATRRAAARPTTGAPSSLPPLDKKSSAARSGRAAFKERLSEHNETNPAMTAGDVDADWEQAYSSGDEAPGGDNPTPDQDVVEEIGRALGVEYQDNEELEGAEKIARRDQKRWELDPASSEDYQDRLPTPRKKKS